MTQTDKDKEPPCRSDYEHNWFMMGVEDNGDNVWLCGTCMTRKYVKKNVKIEYEAPT